MKAHSWIQSDIVKGWLKRIQDNTTLAKTWCKFVEADTGQHWSTVFNGPWA